MEKVWGGGGVWAATTRVCICVLICPNLMRDRLVQTPVPPLPLRFTLSCAAWTRMGGWMVGWSVGWLANGHKRVEKLDRETLGIA